jgi:hypothetical protein
MTAALRIIIPAPLKRSATAAERLAHRTRVVTRSGEDLPVLSVSSNGDRVTLEVSRFEVEVISAFDYSASLPVECSPAWIKPPQKIAKAKKK